MATLLAIAGHRSEEGDSFKGVDDEGADLDDFELWREMKKQVKALREDMDTRNNQSVRSHRFVEDCSWKLGDTMPAAPAPGKGDAGRAGLLPHPPKIELPLRPSLAQDSGRPQNPRLAGFGVDCDDRGTPLINDQGYFMESIYGVAGHKDLLG